ncbi:MAG TPA: ABC transporter permease [Gaiellaceae bacterium]|nr:ABC transporter permease [Gaiellaceae bacterium]
MNRSAVAATFLRVLTQLRRDPRTLALLLVVPCALVTLLKYLFVDRPLVFDRVGGPLLGLFPFIAMFLVASITMLRERTTGTLERLMTLPLAKLDLLLGYAGAFAVVAAVQATAVSALALGVLGLDVEGPAWLVVALAVSNAILGMSLGLFLSAFAQTEFQAVQFMPAFVFPQLLLCGLFVPRSEMARALEIASYCLPLTYAYDALDRVTRGGTLGDSGALDLSVIVVATLLALALGAATLRRRTP